MLLATLGRALGERRRPYSSIINERLRVTGHLFQARFGSVAIVEGVPHHGGAMWLWTPAGAAYQTGGRLALVEGCRAAGGARRQHRERRTAPRPFRRPLRRSQNQ